MKKSLLVLSILFLSVSFAGISAADLNPFAYGLKSNTSNPKILHVEFSVNAKATSVVLEIFDVQTEQTVHSVSCQAYNEKHDYEFDVDLSSIPGQYRGGNKNLNWRVDVKGEAVNSMTFVKNDVKFFAPTSVDIDNNPQNETFGTVFVAESRNGGKGNSKYKSSVDGAGLYILNADGSARRMPNQSTERYGYNGGRVSSLAQYFNGSDVPGYSPFRVRVSDCGRVFLSSMTPDGEVLWEADTRVFSRPDDPSWSTWALAGWSRVLSAQNDNTYKATVKRNCSHAYCGIYGIYTKDTDKFMAGPNVGFDVRGSGANLQLLMLSGCKQALVSMTPAHFYCSEYDLGSAKKWTKEPSRRIFAGHVVNRDGTQVQYDKSGNVWLCQHRSGTDAATLMKFNRDGSIAYDESPRQPNHRCGAIRFNNDFSQVAIVTRGGTTGTGGHVTIYPILSNGMPDWNNGTEVNTMSYTNYSLMDFAWDYANNFYIAADVVNGNAGECIAVYAMPRSADEIISTPAASGQAFDVPCQSGVFYEVTIISDPEEGGTVLVQGNNARAGIESFESCTQLALTAVPEDGYKFVSWTDGNDNILSTNSAYTHFVTDDITLKANFEYATYNVTWWNLFKDGEDIVSNTHDSKRNARLWYLFMPYYNVDGSDKDRDIKPNVGDNKDEYNVLNFGYTATKDILLGTKMEWLGKYLSKVEGNLSNSNSYSDWRACLYPFINRVGYVRSADGTKITSGYWDINYENIKKFANGAADPKAWRPFWCQEACDLDSLIMFSDNMPIDWNQIVGPSQEYDTYTTTLPTSGILTKTPKWYQWNTAPKADQLLAWRDGTTTGNIVHHVSRPDMQLYATYVDKALQEDDPTPDLSKNPYDATNNDVLSLLNNKNYGATAHNVTMDRKFAGNMYNTICLPFDLPISHLPADLKNAEIRVFNGVTETYNESGDPVAVLNFITLDEYWDNWNAAHPDKQVAEANQYIEAGKPYLIKPVEDVDDAYLTYSGLPYWRFFDGTRTPYGISVNGVTFQGVLNPTTLSYGDYILVADNRLAKVTNTSGQLKGFRAYFKIEDAYLQSLADDGRVYLSMKKPVTSSVPVAPEAEQQVAPKARKIMRDGNIYILRGDEVYTVGGLRVK